jgi:hypothetical protein
MSRTTLLSIAAVSVGLLAGCGDSVQPDALTAPAVQYAAAPNACWGQATKVFASTGVMGEHASQQANPRLGLANLARALYQAGAISEPTMAALGAFVADALGLTIDACS